MTFKEAGIVEWKFGKRHYGKKVEKMFFDEKHNHMYIYFEGEKEHPLVFRTCLYNEDGAIPYNKEMYGIE